MSLVVDEVAHIPAGYSYLTQKDFRLNPEHPPLAKNLSALPLLFLDLNFPKGENWQKIGNIQQWDVGNEFIFDSNNNPDQIIFWARVPIIILLLITGWFVFFWTKKIGGNKPALFALTLFCFSPTFIAHGRLVTTDVAATLGFLLGIYFWIKFLQNQNIKNFILSGLTLGIALCLKFSTILLLPVFALTIFLYAFFYNDIGLKKIFICFVFLILIFLFAFCFIIWPIYYFHTINYPAQRQFEDIVDVFIINSPVLENILIQASHNSILRPFLHYAFGLAMALCRIDKGNTVYFLNTLSDRGGWWYYFPVLYLFKVPLALHFICLTFLGLGIIYLKKVKIKFVLIKEWIKKNFSVASLILFFIIYWALSMASTLNIGIRHVLPTFPIIYMILGLGMFPLINNLQKNNKKIISVFLILLFSWYVFSSLYVFPHYLSYYNELAGGTKNGYKIAVDSNYDWGQDLTRLADFVEKNKIEKIKILYFGAENFSYRMGAGAEKLDILSGPQNGWFAISAGYLTAYTSKYFHGYENIEKFGLLKWLFEKHEPIARAGHSIFIYYIE